MRELLEKQAARLPLGFRILYVQFLLRVVDLENLSIDADIPRFLGQIAGLLVFVSLALVFGMLLSPPPPTLAWHMEQSAITNTMFIVALISVLTWDNTFPDRRDGMVLGPLPVRLGTVLLAKVAASGTLLGLAIACLNLPSSAITALSFAGPKGVAAIARFFASYWLTLLASGIFLYGSVLTLQGFSAALLSRRWSLRLSVVFQLAAFVLSFSMYFLAPYAENPADLHAIANHTLRAASPVMWFFAAFNECNGSLPAEAVWLADRAWISLALAMLGGIASLLMSYKRTMRKTIEEPDLVPAGRASRWSPKFGGSLQTTIFLFVIRSAWRSRQHRVILVFFLALAFACALSLVRQAPAIGATAPLSFDFVILTTWMMMFSVLGFRAVFPIPISLNANWVLRLTQLRPSRDYIIAIRRTLLGLAVMPVLAIAFLLAVPYRPFPQACAHLAILSLLGVILVNVSLLGFNKVPFTCSLLPGKRNAQAVFWSLVAGVNLLLAFALNVEMPALIDPFRCVLLLCVFAAAAMTLHAINTHKSKSAVLYFEERSEEQLTQLGLIRMLPPVPREGRS